MRMLYETFQLDAIGSLWEKSQLNLFNVDLVAIIISNATPMDIFIIASPPKVSRKSSHLIFSINDNTS